MVYTELVSLNAHKLLEDIRWLQYGELLAVELTEEDNSTEMVTEKLTQAQRIFAKLIDEGGVRFFHTIKIHQSDPQYATTRVVTPSGHDGIKLHKFN